MKRLFVIALLLCGSVEAENYNVIQDEVVFLWMGLHEALKPLDAIRLTYSFEYIPEYDAHISFAYSSADTNDWQVAMLIIRDLLEREFYLFEGLNTSEWISVSYSSSKSVLVRVKPKQFESLEVWVDGVKQ